MPTTARPTTTTDPYAVPAVIDVTYVNKVLGALDAAVGDIARMVILTRSISPVVTERLHDLYVEQLVELRISSLQHDVDNGFAGYKPNPGNRTTTVRKLITVKPACVFAEMTRDYSAVTGAISPSIATEWVGLMSAPSPTPTNPTQWMFRYDGFTENGSEPRDTCAGA